MNIDRNNGESYFNAITRLSESNQDYLKMKTLLDICLNKYKEQERDELITRLQSSDESFFSTCFEILVHYLFTMLNAEIISHPQLPGSNKRPDFLIKFDNEEFYLELCTIQESDLTQIYQLKEFIRKCGEDIHIVNLNVDELQHVDRIALEKEIKDWYTENRGKSLQRYFQFNQSKYGGVELVIGSSPPVKSENHRTYFHEQLLKKLGKKASKYGKLDKPYIIATTFRPSSISHILEYNTEFYQIEQVLYGIDNATDSFWRKDKKARYTRVSAVLLFNLLTIENALNPIKYVLCLNPEAIHSNLPKKLDLFNIFYIKDGEAFKSDNGLILDSIFTYEIPQISVPEEC